MTTHDPVLEQARKRAKELRDFYGHFFVYLATSALLIFIDLVTAEAATNAFLGLDWAYWPIFGWGVFVLLHGVTTFFNWSRWEDRKTQELYEKEKDRELVHH